MRFRFYVSIAVMASQFCIGSLAGAQSGEMSPAIEAELDKAKVVIATWAADPVIVKEVQEQNKKGPIAGLDNEKWKTIHTGDPIIKSFLENPAGRFLKAKVEAKDSIFTRAFLNGSNGEKAAFSEKTIYYLHKGMPKFEVPFRKGTSWQGKPEFDAPTQTFGIQISTPVLSEGRTAGVLVVEVKLTSLEKPTKK